MVGLPAVMAHAQLVAVYDAGTGPFLPESPAEFFQVTPWAPQAIELPGAPNVATPIVNDASTGLNAWQIDDNNGSNPNTAPNPLYTRCVDTLPTGGCTNGLIAQYAHARGWRFSSVARYVTDYNTDGIGNMGLAVWMSNFGYFVQLDMQGGDLRATIYNAAGQPVKVPLTAGATGDDAYHEFALEFNSITQQVTFEFNGVAKGTTSARAPFGGSHANTLEWGNLGNTERGKMNFHNVEFHLLPPPLAGDYNYDGVVNAVDYTVWRNNFGTVYPRADGNNSLLVDAGDYTVWKANYGNALPAGAGGLSTVPESSPLAICFAALGCWSVVRCGRTGQKRPPLWKPGQAL
jgi:hypothetical protein